MKMQPTPQTPSQWFYLLIIAIGGSFAWIAWRQFSTRNPETRFKVREADRKKTSSHSPFSNEERDKSKPKLLEGISIQGAPHQILGIRPEASEKEILTAYTRLMKRYHPDKLGPPGSREWNDAQAIAAAINQARDAMLKRKT